MKNKYVSFFGGAAVYLASLLPGNVSSDLEAKNIHKENTGIEQAYKMGGCIKNPLEPKRPTRPAFPEEIRGNYIANLENEDEGKEVNKTENDGEGIACHIFHIDGDLIERLLKDTTQRERETRTTQASGYRPQNNLAYLDANPDEMEINGPENKGDSLACVPPVIHPLMPHIDPDWQEREKPEKTTAYRSDDCWPEPPSDPLDPFEPRPGQTKTAYIDGPENADSLALDQCDGDYIRIKIGPIEIERCTPKETSFNLKDAEGVLLADYPNDHYGPADPNPFNQQYGPGENPFTQIRQPGG